MAATTTPEFEARRLAAMRQSSISDALASAAEVDAGGALYAMQDLHEYIHGKAVGKAAKHAKPRQPEQYGLKDLFAPPLAAKEGKKGSDIA